MESEVSPLEVVVRDTLTVNGGPCIVVSLSGRAAVENGAWFRRLLEVQAAGGPTRMVVDVSRLSSMDWWAVLMLMWVARVVRRRGGMLVLAAPLPAVATLLESAGAPQVMPVYGTVRSAVSNQSDSLAYRPPAQPGRGRRPRATTSAIRG